MDKGLFQKDVRKLLKEADRLDAWKYYFKEWVEEETTARKFVDKILAAHPEKKEPVINEIKDISF